MRKISQLLILLLLVFFPTGEIFRITVLKNVNIVPQDLIVFCLFLVIIFKFLKRKIEPAHMEFFKWQIIFICFGVLSLLVNSLFNPSYNFFVSALYPIRYIMYLCILFYPSIVGVKFNVNKILFISGGAIVLLGIPQFLFLNNLKTLFYLGWDDHLYRLFSTFLDPNFVGLFYVIYSGFLLSRIYKKGLNKSNIEIIFLVLTVISIYLTYSRSALLALFVFIVSLCIQLKKTRLLLIIFPVLSIFILLFSNSGVEGLNPLRTASSARRIDSLTDSLVIIEKNPLYGVGFNSYRYAMLKYRLRGEVGASWSNADAGTDNSFLFVLATSGIVGFIIFTKSYFILLNNLRRTETFEGKVILSCFLSLIVGSFFINAMFYIPIVSFVFLMLAFKLSKIRV